MKKTIKQILSWILAISTLASSVPVLTVSSLAANLTESSTEELLSDILPAEDLTEEDLTEDKYFANEIGNSSTGILRIDAKASRPALSARYNIAEETILLGEAAHGSFMAFSSELNALAMSESVVEITDEQHDGIVALISSGYTNSQAYAAYVTGKLLGISLRELIARKQLEIAEKQQAEEFFENLDEAPPEDEPQDRDILHTAIKMGVPYAVIEQYLSESNEPWDALLARFKEAYTETYSSKAAEVATTSANASQRSDEEDVTSYAPEKVLEQPFSYDESGDIAVNLNKGSYSYTETDLSLPGINGLDLNFIRRFQSDNSDVQIPLTYMDDPLINEVCFIVGYKPYLHDQENDTLTEIADISDYNLTSNPGSDMEDFAIYGTIVCVDSCYVIYFTAKQYARAVRAKNSLDVFYVGGREYGSSTTEEIAYVPFIMGNEPNFTDVLDNVVESYDFYPNTYGLGHGWSLGFSAIETYIGGVNEKEKRRLITQDGVTYEIDFTSDEESHLVGYKASDMIMHKSGNGYAGAKYNLEHKDGTREYFNADGKLIAIVNRFGDEITFSYTYDPTNAEEVTAIHITDSLGREVSFEKGSESYDPASLPIMDSAYVDERGEEYYAYNEKWTLALDGTLIKTYYIRTDLISNISYQYLIGAEDALGDITEYRYGNRSYQFNGWVPVASANDEIREACVLEDIIYPNGLMKQVGTGHSQPFDRLGKAGYSDYFSVKIYRTYHETDDGGINLEHKSYTYGDYAGVEPESVLSDTYETEMEIGHAKRVSPTKSYRWTGEKYTYSFDDEEHYKTKEIVEEYPFIQHEDVTVEDTSFSDLTADIRDYTAKRVQETTYEYNDINLPIEISTSYYNPGANAHVR